MRYCIFSLAVAFLLSPRISLCDAAELPLRDGDRVVLLGDALIEQEQYAGWLELALTTADPSIDVTFRNLGWSGDTPAGKSRMGLSLLQAGREPADEGWKQLVSQLEFAKPTVLIVGYGMASALENGQAGLDEFASELERLVQAAKSISPGVRMLLLSPISPLNATSEQYRIFSDYGSTIQEVADRNGVHFVDITQVASQAELRKDSIHLNDEGYRALAIYITSAIKWTEKGKPSGVDWRSNASVTSLREVILRKNEWWFHRSRPANMAYVFGFRKKEQGQNAVEIPMFDELIQEEEERIAELRHLRPVHLREPEPRIASKYAEFAAQPTPEFTVADGWEVSLWAENPQLNKPIHMNFDPQGRLWIASSEAYPMIEVGQAAPDKILVLEDTNGDGKADESTVFADGLLIPTGVAPGEGGVFVAQSTDLLFLQDTDGDGRADVKRRVLSGFGTEDTHHNLHTLVWGPDGRLYMNQSVYTRSDAETPHGVVRLKAGGGFRFEPRSLRMEIVFRGLWNSWGHQFDAFGQSFLTDGAGFDGVAYSFPGASFNPTPNARRQLELISPGKYPKFASLEIVAGNAFPDDWQGSLVTCDFRANRVTRFTLVEQGAGFVTQQQPDLLRTSAATFRPIDVKQGPDGALYVADWSNPIINHGEVDFRDPRRDRWHGRIWRVAWKGAPPQPRFDLSSLSTEQLLERLNSTDRYTLEQARRVLIERGAEVLPELKQWMERQSSAMSRLQGLWLLQALNKVDENQVHELLTVESALVRAAAARVLSYWSDPQAVEFTPIPATAALQQFRQLAVDDHPRVRLEAIHGVARLGSSDAALVALEAMKLPIDRFIEFALAEVVGQLAEPLMKSIENGSWVADTEFRQQQLEFILTCVAPERASNFIAQRLAKQPVSRDGAGPWIELIGKAGGETELEQLYQQLTGRYFESAAAVRGLHSLRDAFRLRKLRPQSAGQSFDSLLSSDHQTRMAAIELAGIWKLGGQVGRINQLIVAQASPNDPNSIQQQLAGVAALGAIGNAAAQDALASLCSETHSFEVRSHALIALAAISAPRATKPFYELLSTIDDEQRSLELWRGVLSKPGTGKVLAVALKETELSAVNLRAAARAVRDGGRNEPELLEILAAQSGSANTTHLLTADAIARLSSRVVTQGDAQRGEKLYRKQELACNTCHAIGGVGGKVGPDMTSLGASAPVDYIVESLFNPNAKIKEGFHSVTVATEDGQIINGIEVSSSDTELVLRDISNKLVRIPQNEIAGKKPGMSLMPSGVVDRLAEAEQLDLIAFLSSLGKPGDYDATQGGIARRFEILAGTHRIEQQGTDKIVSGDNAQGWQVFNCLVNGDWPTDELVKLTAQPFNVSLVHIYARTTFEMAASAKATFTLKTQAPLALWIDGKPLSGVKMNGSTKFEASLSGGAHTLVVRLDARDMPKTLNLTSPDATFATE